jgi:hypothetical protein
MLRRLLRSIVPHVEAGAPVPRGEAGDKVVTSLYKRDMAPMIRFNIHDVSALHTSGNAIGALLENRQEQSGESVRRPWRGPDLADQLTILIDARAR